MRYWKIFYHVEQGIESCFVSSPDEGWNRDRVQRTIRTFKQSNDKTLIAGSVLVEEVVQQPDDIRYDLTPKK